MPDHDNAAAHQADGKRFTVQDHAVDRPVPVLAAMDRKT
ncbi:hypothetical protein BKA21_003544 [Cellulomonas oligotrophica]|uniref:Uncharacterized protein n=1 Tax=Cellulomonas oligotrophica TaxID=931536 RepID=A0A7Y9K150_9CELL|nr:hypothetical protein [Cellulomonas oligotrophica]